MAITSQVGHSQAGSRRRLRVRRRRDAFKRAADNDVWSPNYRKWTSTFQWYYVEASKPSYLDATNTLNSLRSAKAEWAYNDNYCGIGDFADVLIAYQGTISTSFGQNGISSVGFGRVCDIVGACGALAVAGTWTSGTTAEGYARIVEGDVRMDTEFHTWVNGGASGKYDVWSVMAHESGHNIGYGDITDTTNVMWGSQNNNDMSKRRLGRGDANMNNYFY